MNVTRYWVAPTLAILCVSPALGDEASDRSACEALTATPNLTIAAARIVPASDSAPAYCHAKGIISPAISWHVQLPLPANWNGRFLKWGDGGKDGDLDFADHRVAEGYAVANSNMGHDNGSEPGASFAFNNRQAEIDFGYRAVHLTVNAAKSLIARYYGEAPQYAYFEGCSTGGREGLMEAQRYPGDFDGIVAGAPVYRYQELNAGHVWLLQRVFRNGFAGNLAHDSDGDGSLDSLSKLDILADTVMAKCDVLDGIEDGVIDDPLSCGFHPDIDLAPLMCSAGRDGEHCFTAAQLQTVKDYYSGPYDSGGVSIIKGRAPDRDAVPPEPTLDYYERVVAETFAGDLEAARDRTRLFMFPGVRHCRGGAGPDRWDPLAPLVDWVENGEPPDHVVAHRETDGRVDNERRVCAHPEHAFYTGPDGGRNDPQNWVQANFSCR